MSLSRVELDGIGSPEVLAANIHLLAPDLSLDFDVRALCRQLDIHEIVEKDTTAFEAAIIMDDLKAEGAILLARSSTAKRKRFSIAHELGHFLLPDHLPNSEGFSCSHGDLASSDTADRDRHAQVEAEANRFAAHLLMPPKKIRANMASPRADLAEVARLSDAFFVSKEAMARSYVDAHHEPLALVFLHHGIVRRFYAAERFPYLEVGIGLPAPEHSIASGIVLGPLEASAIVHCDPATWLGERARRKVVTLSEQVLVQREGHAMVLLHAEMRT